MIKRFLLVGLALLAPLWAHGDWAADRDASAGYVTVTTLATAIDEAVPFCVVYMSDLSADFWSAMDAASDTDGKTIRVSTSDGVTQLACVPIGVNTGTDTGCLIFLGTGMSASVDVDYRIYVGNASLSMPSASGGMGEQAVFASYAGVYFPGVDTRDWTSGGRTLTAVGTPGTTASGYEGITAATYNGSSQYHYHNGAAVTNWPITLEALAYPNNLTATSTMLALGDSSSTLSMALLSTRGGDASDPLGAQFRGGSGSISIALKNGYSEDVWQYYAGSRGANTGTSCAYINGGTAATETTTITTPTLNRTGVGTFYRNGASSAPFDGNVAVALLSVYSTGTTPGVRSADYVSTMQDNWAGTMYSAGAWTALGSCGSGGTGLVLFGSNSQTSTANENWNDLPASLLDDATTTDVVLDDGGVYLSETITYSGADLSAVPAGASSYTVKFYIKRRGDTNTAREINDLVVRFRDGAGTLQGDNLANLAGVWPTTAATATYTLTGYSPDGTDFTSSTGLDLQATGIDTNGATTAEVYTVWIEVLWEGAPCDEGSNWFSMWD